MRPGALDLKPLYFTVLAKIGVFASLTLKSIVFWQRHYARQCIFCCGDLVTAIRM